MMDHHEGPYETEAGDQRDRAEMMMEAEAAFEKEKRPGAQECGECCSSCWKSKDQEPSLEPPEGPSPADTLTVTQ